MAAILTLHAIRLTLIVIFLYTLTFRFTLSSVYAGSGLVSSIGGVTFVQGAKHFWVTMTRPTFSGVTTAGAAVSGTVGSQSVAATANSSGNWSWTPAADLSGDNTVTITSGSTTASFTLTIGQLPANIATASGSALSPAGSIAETFALFAAGFLIISIGSFGLARSFSKSE